MIRTYIATNYNNKIVKIVFDKLNPTKVTSNTAVNTISVLRGRDKTFGTYRKPKTISISGSFSDRLDKNIYIDDSPRTIKSDDKIKTLVNLFNSFIEDTRLFNIITFYKEYKNYTLTKFSVVYSYNSTIDVTLDFQEVMFRENDKIIYSIESDIYPRESISEIIDDMVHTENTKNYIESSKGIDVIGDISLEFKTTTNNLFSSEDLYYGLKKY